MDVHARTNRAKGTITTVKIKKTSTSACAAYVAQQSAHSASKKPASKRSASRKKNAPTAQRGAKEPSTRTTAPAKGTTEKPAEEEAPNATSAATPRKLTKKAIVLDLLRRESGTTLSELAEATGWKPNSVAGLISGVLRKKMGLNIGSSRQNGHERIYKIE